MDENIVMLDRYIEKILICTSQKPMTAKKISELYDIPIAICNKKMRMLESLGLVVCVKKLTLDNDGMTKFFIASEKRVKVEHENGRYVVKINVPLNVAMELSKE